MGVETLRLRTVIIFFLLLLIAVPAEALVLKIATLSPEGSMWMQKMREGAEVIARKTGRRVRFKFYPGGVMGNDQAVLRKIRIGQLQGGAITAGSLAGIFPDHQIYSLPLKFKSYGAVDYVRKRMDPLMIGGIEKSGFVTFGLAGGGFAYLMSNAPIKTIEDLRRQKIWIPDNDPAALEAVKAFDITPFPLSMANVRAALQTGLIDTVATTPSAAIVLQWHTQIKYLTDMPLLYVYGLLALDQKAFKKISPKDQAVVREVMGSVFREFDRRDRQNNQEALDALQKQGIQLVKPDAESLQEWYGRAEEATQKLIQVGRLSSELVKALESHLAAYRSQHSKSHE